MSWILTVGVSEDTSQNSDLPPGSSLRPLSEDALGPLPSDREDDVLSE